MAQAGGPLDADRVVAVARACGFVARSATPLGRGAISEAWRVETDGAPLVVRAELPEHADAPPDRRARFEAQHAVLTALHAVDARAPRPIATARDVADDPLDGRTPWAVSSLIEGDPFDAAGSPPDVAREVGALLAALHALPAEGYGLLADDRTAIRGAAADPAAGILSRWPTLWPFDGRPLIAHAVARLAPALLADLARLRDPLLRWGTAPAATVCHGDPHAEHIRVVEGRLSGMIDFGDAFVAAPAWDVAMFAWHHGWALTEALLGGYTPKRLIRELRVAEAEQLAIAVVLGRLEKALRAGDGAGDPRPTRAIAFLAETLPRAARRAG